MSAWRSQAAQSQPRAEAAAEGQAFLAGGVMLTATPGWATPSWYGPTHGPEKAPLYSQVPGAVKMTGIFSVESERESGPRREPMGSFNALEIRQEPGGRCVSVSWTGRRQGVERRIFQTQHHLRLEGLTLNKCLAGCGNCSWDHRPDSQGPTAHKPTRSPNSSHGECLALCRENGHAGD